MTSVDQHNAWHKQVHDLITVKSWLTDPGPVTIPDPVRKFLLEMTSTELEDLRENRKPQ